MAEADSNGRSRHEKLKVKLERAEKKNALQRVAEIEDELTLPPFPVVLSYLWRAYMRLRRRKGSTDMGSPKPIEWVDIDAFVNRSGLRLVPWEIELIESLDDIYLKPEPKPTAPEGQPANFVASAKDGIGVRSILNAVGKRRVVKRKKGG